MMQRSFLSVCLLLYIFNDSNAANVGLDNEINASVNGFEVSHQFLRRLDLVEDLMQLIKPKQIDFCDKLTKESTLADKMLIDSENSIPEANLNCSYECENSKLSFACNAACDVCVFSNSTSCARPSAYAKFDFSEGPIPIDMSILSCAIYSQGVSGEVCLQEINGMCEVSYNQELCTSCNIVKCNEVMQGFEADCTNIDSDARINTCTNEGAVGVFTMVDAIVNQNTKRFAGVCEGGSDKSHTDKNNSNKIVDNEEKIEDRYNIAEKSNEAIGNIQENANHHHENSEINYGNSTHTVDEAMIVTSVATRSALSWHLALSSTSSILVSIGSLALMLQG